MGFSAAACKALPIGIVIFDTASLPGRGPRTAVGGEGEEGGKYFNTFPVCRQHRDRYRKRKIWSGLPVERPLRLVPHAPKAAADRQCNIRMIGHYSGVLKRGGHVGARCAGEEKHKGSVRRFYIIFAFHSQLSRDRLISLKLQTPKIYSTGCRPSLVPSMAW